MESRRIVGVTILAGLLLVAIQVFAGMGANTQGFRWNGWFIGAAVIGVVTLGLGIWFLFTKGSDGDSRDKTVSRGSGPAIGSINAGRDVSIAIESKPKPQEPFRVVFSKPWAEPQADSGMSVIRMEVTMSGAKGKVSADLVNMKAERKTKGTTYPLEWEGLPDQWVRVVPDEPRTVTLGEAFVDPKGGFHWFAVRGPGPPPSQGTDRMRPLAGDTRVYCQLRVSDKKGHSDTSDVIALGGTDGQADVGFRQSIPDTQEPLTHTDE